MAQAASGPSTDDPDEIFDLVDLSDRVIGQVRRGDAHRDPRLLHRSVQVLVFDSHGRLLLQRRSQAKDLFPGYFCASASGHVVSGDDYATTADREVAEELGTSLPVTFLGKAIVRSDVETELTALFAARSDGPFVFHPGETDGGEFAPLDSLLDDSVERHDLTPALHTALEYLRQRRQDGTLADLMSTL
jgi:16S rRNA (adenine1518-N6/adenine1519-N6)-dimethyltransferase